MPVSIDPDQQKNEETTKLRYITPVILERWQDVDKVLMEYYFTDGRISVDEYNMAHRGKPKKADYLLLFRDNIPLAIVEAKAIDHSADEGYSQAVEYANILDVPFAYATNGVDLIEKDTVKLHIDVYDEAEWDVSNRDDPVDDDFVIYPKGEENATEPKHEIQPTDIVLFDNNACSMVICGFYSDSFMGYTAKAYYQNKTDDRIDIILDKGSINGFECTPEGAALLEPHSNAYVDIRWQEYAGTYAENGNDPTFITEIVMPVFVRKDTGSNTVYIDATYSIDPQARTATPIVNPQ